MRAIILAGGLGTRLSEETYNKPKPMVKVGSLTLLEHIMETYAFSNIKEFIIATGYLSETIEKYFKDFTKYKVTIMYTGEETQTGGRLKKVVEQFPDEMFCATYGDGLANIDIDKSIKFHLQHKKIATVTAVRPQARFGRLTIENQKVVRFDEKLQLEEGWVNGGFFVLNRNIIDYIDGDSSPFEAAPLKKLTMESQLMAFQHHGFWSPVDTLREKNELEDLWVKEKAPWLIV
jgi:glucose-1-phosphate cytidylyltransferase